MIFTILTLPCSKIFASTSTPAFPSKLFNAVRYLPDLV